MHRSRSKGRFAALAALAIFTWAPIVARGGDPPSKEIDPGEAEFFEARVRPLLASRCQSCHGAEKRKGGLRLDRRDEAMKGGDQGPAIVPGKPDESPLIDAINYGDLRMPPKSKLPAE